MTYTFVLCNAPVTYRPGTRCAVVLLKVGDDFTGTIETKCAGCRTMHTRSFTFGTACTSEPSRSGPLMWRDVRCNNTFKGRQSGGWCGQLVMRISTDSAGTFEYKDQRSCKRIQTVRIDVPAMQLAST